VSADGSQAVASRYLRDKPPSISVFSTTTGKEQHLTSHSGRRACYHGCWVGDQIVFMSSATWPTTLGTEEDLWTMDANGGNKSGYLDNVMSKLALRFIPSVADQQ
jgi:Tol biopolymer transport system component